MTRRLSEQERIDLQKRHKKERDKRICDRIKAVLLFDKGYSYTKIAEILLLDDETIRRHINKYFSQHKIAPENGGSESFLSAEQAAELLSHLETHTYLYVKTICAYVKQVFDIEYSISGMTQWLHRQGFRYKKPHGVPSKADIAKQADFIDFYTQLKASIAADEAIFFGDSVHPAHQTRLAYGWIKKGVRKAEKLTACQKRMNIIGAINLETHHVVTQDVDWVNVDSLKMFCEKLIKANPKVKKIHLILDNAGYHKSKAFTEWIADKNICLHYLPAYSPNLNPIERLWKIMHEHVTYNQYYEKFALFKNAIMYFFEHIDDYMNDIKSRITDNFQKLVAA